MSDPSKPAGAADDPPRGSADTSPASAPSGDPRDGTAGGGGEGTDGPGDASPEFGPSGYLPARAAQRARKIVLRAPLGAQWIIGAVVAGLVVVVAGVWFLVTSGDPPPDPWVAAGEVDDVGEAAHDPDLDALLVGAGGRIRAFADAADVTYCAASNQLEAPDGRVWSLTGRGLGGAASLEEHPTLVQDGVLYVDPTRTQPGPSPSDEPAEPAC